MPKVAEYKDMFKFKQELLEEDYNPGKALVINTKHAANSHDLSSSIQIGQRDAEGMSSVNVDFYHKFATKDATWDYWMRSSKEKESALGLQSNLPDIRAKINFHLNTAKTLDIQYTYLHREQFLFGFRWAFDHKPLRPKYFEHGLVWEPAKDLNVALKYEANCADGSLTKGNFCFFFHQRLAQHAVGAEFIYNSATNTSGARFGLHHRFQDGLEGKLKVTHEGQLSAVLKRKLSDHLTASVTSGLSLRRVLPFPGQAPPHRNSARLRILRP